MSIKTLKIIAIGSWIWLVWSMRAVWARLRGKSTTFIVHGFANDGIRRIYEPLGIHVNIINNITSLPDDKPIVLVGNHPASYAFWAVARAFDACLTGKHPKVAAAMRHNFTPLGWAIKAMGGITINRRNKRKAEHAIAHGITDAQKNTVVMIYPEGHRPFPERIKENQARLAAHGDHALSQRFKHTLSGRPAGIHTIRQCLPNATWLCMYVGSDVPHITKAKDIEKLEKSIIDVYLANIEPPPDDREGIKNWLNEELLGPCNDYIDNNIEWRTLLESKPFDPV